MKATRFQKYLLPGLVFQSVIIGGGYGTGREIVEFFLQLGPLPGLLAISLVTTLVFSVVSAISFELARRFRAYDYRSFFRCLLGRGWALFEITYLVTVLLVVAVLAAAAGSIGEETFGLPYAAGVLVVLAAVATLLFFGSGPLERVFAAWSFVLYAVYAVFFVWAVSRFGGRIVETLANDQLDGSWIFGGVRYASYNLVAVPIALFATRHIETRREALTAGLLTGPIGILPGVLFYFVLLAHHPEILDSTVPANDVLAGLGSRGFQIVFQLVLFGTLIESGAGLIHAVNERLDSVFRERGGQMPAGLRSIIALVVLGLALLLSRFGLVDLIARGYGMLTWLYLLVYLLPVMTLGVWLITRPEPACGRLGPR